MKEEQMSMLDHPSIAGRIALLETEVEAKQTSLNALEEEIQSLRKRNTELSLSNARYEEKVKNCLIYVAEELDGDTETIKNIGEQIAIDLTTTKSYEMNVTINLEIEVPFGHDVPESGDIENDFNVSIDSYEYTVVDYSVDPIYCHEA